MTGGGRTVLVIGATGSIGRFVVASAPITALPSAPWSAIPIARRSRLTWRSSSAI